jgi:hypothetical protein
VGVCESLKEWLLAERLDVELPVVIEDKEAEGAGRFSFCSLSVSQSLTRPARPAERKTIVKIALGLVAASAASPSMANLLRGDLMRRVVDAAAVEARAGGWGNCCNAAKSR